MFFFLFSLIFKFTLLSTVFYLHSITFSGTPVHDVLVNVFALGSRLGLAAGWTAQAVMTIEVYPTVVRLVLCCFFQKMFPSA